MTRFAALLTTAVLAAALLAGCTSDGGDEPTVARDPGTGAPSSALPSGADDAREAPESADTAAPPPAPEEGACYRLTLDELAQPSNASEPVPCRRRHDARTIHVGRLDLVVDGDDVAVDSARVRARLARSCPARMAAHLGGTPEARNLSRFEVVWFSPTPEEADRGADWFRCDLVALADQEGLFPLPRRTTGILDRPGALARYGLCGTAAPGTSGFERVICARQHSWQAIATIPLPGGRAYPGAARVRSAGDGTCRDTARAEAEDPLEFRYGWEWPTREQWANGQRFGYCWVPA